MGHPDNFDQAAHDRAFGAPPPPLDGAAGARLVALAAGAQTCGFLARMLVDFPNLLPLVSGLRSAIREAEADVRADAREDVRCD